MDNQVVAAFIGALAEIESPLKFWAFVAVVFLALTIAFFRSDVLHKTWARVVGEDLARNHRFRIVRLVVAGFLVIAVLALVLAFLAPLLLRRMEVDQEAVQLSSALATYAVMLDGSESESVQRDFASAMEAFKAQDYPTARRRMLSLQRQVVSKQSLEAVQGLITATYYGRQEHVDGIKFLCDQYRGQPKWDARFRYQIHAHVRRIAINEGYEDAEKVVASLRPRCQRGDLSPIWAGIGLGAIERLVDDDDYLPNIDGPDKAFLQYAINRYPNDSMLDHALLFLDRDEEVLSRFPNSMLTLLALRRVASRRSEAGDHQAAAEVAERYLAMLPKTFSSVEVSPRTRSVVETLGRSYLELGRIQEARQLAEKFRDPAAEGVPNYIYFFATSAFEKVVRAADLIGAIDKVTEAGFPYAKIVELLPELPPQTTQLLSDGAFAEAAAEYNLAVTILNERKIPLPEHWPQVGQAMNTMAQRVDALTAPNLLASGLGARAEANGDQIPWELVPAARAFSLGLWKRCIYRDPQSVEAMKAAYLRATALRRAGKFRDAANEFQALVTRHGQGELADDALAELVSYNVQVLENEVAAKQYMQKLQTEYPSGNAVDNALYILGNFYRDRRDFTTAVHYYSAVAVNYSGQRLAIASSDIAASLQEVLASKKPRIGVPGLHFYADADEEATETGTYIDSVDAGSGAANAGLLAGDHVTAVAGRSVETVAQFYYAIAGVAVGEEVEITVNRGFDDKQVTLRAKAAQETYYAKAFASQ